MYCQHAQIGPLLNHSHLRILQLEKYLSKIMLIRPTFTFKMQNTTWILTFFFQLVGWGHDISGNASNILLGGHLPFISKSECLKLVNIEFSHSIADDKFCAGTLSGWYLAKYISILLVFQNYTFPLFIIVHLVPFLNQHLICLLKNIHEFLGYGWWRSKELSENLMLTTFSSAIST